MVVTQRKGENVVSSEEKTSTTTNNNDDINIPEGYKLRKPRENIKEMLANGAGEDETLAESLAFPLFVAVAFVASLFFYLKLPSLLRSE